MFARRAGFASVVLFAAVAACGESKTPDLSSDKPSDAKAAATPSTSLLAKACETQSDPGKKQVCLCQESAIRAELSPQLFAKLETAKTAASTDAVVEHLGGMSNLSSVYHAMRGAAEQCKKGAAQ